MALTRCPECRGKLSHTAQICVHCGFDFSQANQAIYRQKLTESYQKNQQINQKSNRLHLIWLTIFVLVLGLASWWIN